MLERAVVKSLAIGYEVATFRLNGATEWTWHRTWSHVNPLNVAGLCSILCRRWRQRSRRLEVVPGKTECFGKIDIRELRNCFFWLLQLQLIVCCWPFAVLFGCFDLIKRPKLHHQKVSEVALLLRCNNKWPFWRSRGTDSGTRGSGTWTWVCQDPSRSHTSMANLA